MRKVLFACMFAAVLAGCSMPNQENRYKVVAHSSCLAARSSGYCYRYEWIDDRVVLYDSGDGVIGEFRCGDGYSVSITRIPHLPNPHDAR